MTPPRITEAKLQTLGLSPAEIRVALIIAQGKNAVQVAVIIGRSHETVRKHLTSIRDKTGLRRQSAIAAFVVRMELQNDTC
jgi:DNA-binding CsgD family transcriptional regulator